MAISYVLGNPGSGKTYYGVYEIYKYFYPNKEMNKGLVFKDDKENLLKYDFCYTNIDSLKYDEFNNVLNLNFEELKFHLTNLYNLKISEQEKDSILIDYCKENKIYNTLFVIDEIHNYFNKSDKILIWWLTYHRHLHHDLILITQNLTLVANEYKQIAEFFYKAVDGGKRLFMNKLRYVRFSDYRMYNNSIVQGGGKSIKLYPFIYNLYHSGANGKSKSFVKKYIIAAICLFLLAVAIFFYTIQNFGKGDVSTESKNIPGEQINQSLNANLKSDNRVLKSNDDLDINYYYEVLCIQNYCYIKSNNNDYYPIPTSYFFNVLSKNNFEYKSKERTFKNTVKYFIVSNKDIFINLIKKDEKVSNETNSFNNLNNSAGVSIF